MSEQQRDDLHARPLAATLSYSDEFSSVGGEPIPGPRLTPVAQVTGHTEPRAVTAEPMTQPVIFTAEEARRGCAIRGNTKHYCCYGKYCDAGHTKDCTVNAGVPGPDGSPQ